MDQQSAHARGRTGTYGVGVLSRILAGTATVIGAAVMTAGFAAAQPPAPAPPPAPNVNAWPPVSPAEFTAMNGTWYAFGAPGGLTCVIQRGGAYGCSGPIPAAPGGANLVSGGIGGVPTFANAAAPFTNVVETVNPLPANTRISFQTVSCGTDGTMTTCVDAHNGAGFVISPTASFVLQPSNPLLLPREGRSPYFN
ncbi:hypothetical protein AU195_24645 [Mycobacterium sp. IS-1496]|uniref:hypothetical protein n=1 Tax=Mycobacterium sp. IS-1496 TaxID=1772284 RepID=UPI00074180A1|nr:hypothetical protein [Mycobacterium sp. IS-1496]KUI30516.1 hypothetical protein AU195_24645 [Mycobacterium sp. IS-1496]